MTPQGRQHPTHRSVVRDRVSLGEDRAEMKAPVLFAAQPSARAMLVLAGCLHVVEPLLVGLPYVNRHPLNRLAFAGADLSADEARCTLRAIGDIRTVFVFRRALDEEWTEHRSLGATGRSRVVLRRHEHR